MFSLNEKNREENEDVMFPDEFSNVLMHNEPKVETSSDVPRKSSANFLNLRKRSYGF